MKLKGTIEIDAERGTISLKFDNGSFCSDHYPNGIKHFLEDEIECVKKNGTEPHTLYTGYPKGWGPEI